MVNDISYREEVFRKFGHILTGIVTITLGILVYRAYGMQVLRSLLFVAVLFSFFADYVRLDLGLHVRGLRFLERKREVHTLHATTFALLGALLALEFFDPMIALTSIAMFFFGDAAAAWVGKSLNGPRLFRKKTLWGTSAMFLVSLVSAFVLLDSVAVIFAMAFSATLVELFVEKIDDSFAIIVFAGFVGQVFLGF